MPEFKLTVVAAAVAVLLAPSAHAQQTDEAPIESIQVAGSWLGSGLQNSVKNFAGARTVVDKEEIAESGAANIGDVLRRIPGVQSTDNSGTAGSAISLNIGVRGLTGRYSPRSTVLLDGIPLAVAPYGQPQLSFAPVSLNNIESIDVVRGGGAVRYGPQNVGGIINFRSRAIPEGEGLSGDASVRYNDFGEGGSNRQYSAFVGGTAANGLGLALMYSGMEGREWRKGSDERVNDFALKFRYPLNNHSEVYGKLTYFDVQSQTPGGLTVAQYNADPYQNTRPTDFWNGDRKGADVGYLNTLSATQEFEVKAYYNESFRQSSLINAARTQIAWQPRNYQVTGIEPRYTQRFDGGGATHDVTVGYRYLRERGDDNSYTQTVATGANGAITSFINSTDAHAAYIDDRIALGAWRITPGVRYESIASTRNDVSAKSTFETDNNKALPSLNVAYLVNRALTVFANYTTSFGAVQNIQLNSQTPANPLKPEVAKTAELGARWKSGAVHAEATVFRLKFDNQIVQVPGITPATFQNIGATKHEGVETAADYSFDEDGALAGLNVYANYSYTKAIQESGATAGLDVPFYSRNSDTVGARYRVGAWSFNLSSTHQSKQYSDTANTVAEAANGGAGLIPGFRVWNAQLAWKQRAYDITAGVNNLADHRYYTRNVDGNAGRMAAAPRTAYVQLHLSY
ncbi:Fe(3+) dicitrate transport protein [Duganella sp. CF402]|uniref:TonB-dependent receptor family protein n=1 Tax=unclassified Duganella TaxID=2636909 RepID=UPI0008D6EBF7|nr:MULTISPECIES: TonB-dependent siderophore receptor [unclassified Duganella]RZT10619.1 Fe(3+) dicitrate transport protein [Duganella sp. BK701]SEL05760.1 Fe(3+) dicitrate transport protein [Duganella sp. CF402]